jgi:ketosteroid isomerase-like protein
MSAEDNIKTIQVIYEAFGRGDVAAILESVTDDVDWASDTSNQMSTKFGSRHLARTDSRRFLLVAG